MSGTPSNLPKPLATAKAPLLTAEAFADLQRRALLKGLRLTRSESNGETRVWLDGREVVTLDALDAIVVHVRSPWDPPLAPAKAQPASVPSLRQLEDEQRLRDARMELESARIAGVVAGRRVGAHLIASIESMNAAETAIDRAKRAA